MIPNTDWLTLDEMITTAHAVLAPELWDYVVGGVESETTLRRNRLALDSLALVPRVLRDVSAIDLSTSLLGLKLAMPIAPAPYCIRRARWRRRGPRPPAAPPASSAFCRSRAWRPRRPRQGRS